MNETRTLPSVFLPLRNTEYQLSLYWFGSISSLRSGTCTTPSATFFSARNERSHLMVMRISGFTFGSAPG